VRSLALLEDRPAVHLDVERLRPDHEVVEDRGRGGRELVRACSRSRQAACARPCSKDTHAGERNGRIAIAMTTIAAARPIRTEATFSPTVPVTGAS
jgi:hypothetical protein